jgi:UPF0755 protein
LRHWKILALLLPAAAAGLFAAWLNKELTTPYFAAGETPAFVDIPRGSAAGAIASALTSAGIIRHRVPFLLYVRWAGLSLRLQAGEYRFSSPAKPSQVAGRLVAGDVFFHSLTIPEGLTARETIGLVCHAGLGDRSSLERLLGSTEWIADLDPNATSLEGYLFPDTYRISRHATPEEILLMMIARFRAALDPLVAGKPLPGKATIGQIVTIASMVEKEAGSPDDRRLIASVIWNRLRRNMPLACDPTIIYALKVAGTFDGNLRKKDLSLASPYNTYTHAGLPPGPISNPGADSLRAALFPAESDYLYYVSKNDGTHHFSRDFRSHQLAVARYQKRRS